MLQSVFEITLSMSFIIIAVLLLMPILDKRYSAKWRYFIWLFITIRLVIPFNLTIPEAPIVIEPPTEKTVVFRAENTNFPVAVVNAAEYTDKGGQSPSSADYAPIITVADLLKYVWLLGAGIFILYKIGSYIIFRIRIRKFCKYTENSNIKEICDEIGIRNKPLVLICDKIASPMMVGFFRPVILLPEVSYSDSELMVILKHELTHLKRNDLWYKLILVIANGMHWFNPVVYLMVRQANRDLEYSCDDAVVKNSDMDFRKDYSMTILKSMENSRATVLSTYLSKNGTDEKRRFKNKFKEEKL